MEWDPAGSLTHIFLSNPQPGWPQPQDHCLPTEMASQVLPDEPSQSLCPREEQPWPTSATQPQVWLKYQIQGEPGWQEPDPRPNPPSWSRGSRAGTHPAAPRQELILRHCQAAGTKGHFYKILLVSLSFQSLQTSESPLLPALHASSHAVETGPSLQLLRPGAITFAHPYLLIQKQFRNSRVKVSDLWFSDLKNISILVYISREGGKSLLTSSFQYLLQILYKQVRNLEHLLLADHSRHLIFFC